MKFALIAKSKPPKTTKLPDNKYYNTRKWTVTTLLLKIGF